MFTTQYAAQANDVYFTSVETTVAHPVSYVVLVMCSSWCATSAATSASPADWYPDGLHPVPEAVRVHMNQPLA
jgi:hypothetical protein